MRQNQQTQGTMKRIDLIEYVEEAGAAGAPIRHLNRRASEPARVQRGLRHHSARQRRVTER